MQKRSISNTGLEVSAIGLGTVKFGRNQGVKYPTSFSLPTDDEILHLLSVAADLGVNLLDTAPAYGTSEERLGKLLKGQRHQWILSTKVGEEFMNGESKFDFSKTTIINSVERSLKRLGTDYLDIVLVHSNGDDEHIIKKDNAFLTLADLKRAGKIRAFGMSSKTIAGGILTIDHADVAMVTHNVVHTAERDVIAYAEQQKKSIFIKKAHGSGHLNTSIADNLRFIFAEPGVTSVIVGTVNPKHLQENVAVLNGHLN